MVFRLDGDASPDAFAVLPAWTEDVVGVKAFTYLPSNAAKDLPILHSKIMLFDRQTGEPLDLVDGTSVTYWRTAGVAGIAADYLARADAARLLVCGTGNLAPYMALAHAAVRPIRQVAVWGRGEEKARATIEEIAKRRPDLECVVAGEIEDECGRADVITCVTAAHDPIIKGAWVGSGTHTDFFGNHERHGRECDTEMVTRSRVYVDSKANVLNEAGEILIPIEEGAFTEQDIVGELADLCAGRVKGRGGDDEITFFKSVGTALSDLSAARYVSRAQ
jgi:1-pyrroline-2-carboxylate reductase [NAD(P)H]